MEPVLTFINAGEILEDRLQTASVSGSQSAYDLLFTSQDNGDYGRIRASATNSAINLAYPDLRRKVPVSLDLEHV